MTVAPLGLSFRGDPDDLRVTATQVARQPRSCPAGLWTATRPAIWPDVAGDGPKRERWPFFLDRIADERPQTSDLHPGVATFVRHAAEVYADVAAIREVELGTPLLPCDPRRIDVPKRELECWALWYDSPDRQIREVRRLRHGVARGQDADDQAWAAVAAKLAVDGVRAGATHPDPPPRRVVVVEIGLTDGSTCVTFDGDVEAARATYDTLARPRIEAATCGIRFVPGRDCGGCRHLTGCPAMPRVPGVLGLPEPGFATRSVSASDLDTYAHCAARYYLSRVAHVPADSDTGPAQARGQAVHRWLAAAHTRGAACAEADLPDDGEVRGYLAAHLASCPLGFAGVDAVCIEAPRYVYDPLADVVVATSPDLVFITESGPVWRETKTTTRPRPADPAAAMTTYLAAAVDIVVLDALGGGTVELELLSEVESSVFAYDTFDPAVVAAARERVAAAAAGWHTDQQFTAAPGPGCDSCPVRRWCPSSAVTLEL